MIEVSPLGFNEPLPPSGSDRPIFYGMRLARPGGLGEGQIDAERIASWREFLHDRLTGLLRTLPDGSDHIFHYATQLEPLSTPAFEAGDKFLMMRHADDSLLLVCLPFSAYDSHRNIFLAVRRAWADSGRAPESFPFQYYAGGVMSPAVLPQVEVRELIPDIGTDCLPRIESALKNMLKQVRTELSLSESLHLDICAAQDRVSKN